MTSVQEIWFDNYKILADNPAPVVSDRSHLPRSNQSRFDSMLDLDNTDDKATPVNRNPYDGYTSRKPVKKSESQNLLEWWMVHETSEGKVAKMAWDFLSIPSMSAECERTFSSAALTLSDQQNLMKADTLEACECLRVWFRQKVGGE